MGRLINRTGWAAEILELADQLENDHPAASGVAGDLRAVVSDYRRAFPA